MCKLNIKNMSKLIEKKCFLCLQKSSLLKAMGAQCYSQILCGKERVTVSRNARNAPYILIIWYFVPYITIFYIPTWLLWASHVTLVSLDMVTLTSVHFDPFNGKLKQNFHKFMIHYAYCKRNKTYCKFKSIMLITKVSNKVPKYQYPEKKARFVWAILKINFKVLQNKLVFNFCKNLIFP